MALGKKMKISGFSSLWSSLFCLISINAKAFDVIGKWQNTTQNREWIFYSSGQVRTENAVGCYTVTENSLS
jgi:hypothetical protein